MIVIDGECPVCEGPTRFESPDGWFRDHLLCTRCGSIPRERAFAWALDRFRADWRRLDVHESSPADREVSRKLRQGCARYVASQYYSDVPGGGMKDGFRSENLEAMSFATASLDLHRHLDVMEHVNRPDLCLREMARTLRPGGMAIFTVPVYKDRVSTRRAAIYFHDGIEHLEPPEYHGNPIDAQGALVTFRYGQDFTELMRAWAPEFSILQILPNDARLGIIGEFRDVFVLTRNSR